MGVLQVMGLFLAAGVFGYLTRRIGDKYIKQPDQDPAELFKPAQPEDRESAEHEDEE